MDHVKSQVCVKIFHRIGRITFNSYIPSKIAVFHHNMDHVNITAWDIDRSSQLFFIAMCYVSSKIDWLILG